MMGMPPCKEVVQLISSDELLRQPWHRKLSVRVHLLMCRHCSAYVLQIRAIGQAIRDRYTEDDLDSMAKDLVERLKGR